MEGRALVVDDDPEVLAALAQLLQDWGLSVMAARDGAAALRLVAIHGHPDAVVTDFRLPEGESGLDVLRRLRAVAPAFRGVVLSGDIGPDEALEVQRSGYALLLKPVSAARLRSTVGELLDSGG